MATHPDDFAFDGQATEIRQTKVDGGVVARNPTLTKREYFAAMAMQGLCAREFKEDHLPRTVAAVALADLLIEELNKEKVT